MAGNNIRDLIAGREPPPLPGKMPKLFQIGKVALLPNESIPETLNVTGERTQELMKGVGLFKPGSGHILVRGLLFGICALRLPEMRKKLTIMISTDE
ncbi:hypothetical protein C8Q77DRAFT_1152367 [Trametes polyzona]|nr:hypothetical protein C8Q77DRAFT_1152367 [Trametes polyzona]